MESGFLTKLDKHTVGGFRVEEGYSHPVRSYSRLFIDELKSFTLKPRKLFIDIFNLQGDMMDALAAFFEKTRDR